MASASARESGGEPFAITEVATFDEPWALAIEPGTGTIFVTEKKGSIAFVRSDGARGAVSGVPDVDYGGQGGLGDIVFAPDYAESGAIYLTWVEAGSGGTRGAVLGKAKLACASATACALDGLKVIWRQDPKVSGRGHYSHRIAFSPDGQYLYLSSGDRQKKTPAQDLSVNLGKVLRLMPDGSAAPGNPFADKGGVSAQIWSYGHRNVLGLAFDKEGRLWDLEHGPAGGDELNLVKEGANYGWPLVSNGDNYGGSSIPDHSTRPDLAAPSISWTPVIAPGDFIFYDGAMFPQWQGHALITGLKTEALIDVAIEGESAREVGRHDFGERLRDIAQAPDGSVLLIEDGPGGRLLRLTTH